VLAGYRAVSGTNSTLYTAWWTGLPSCICDVTRRAIDVGDDFDVGNGWALSWEASKPS
jgi:hypothetical protein